MEHFLISSLYQIRNLIVLTVLLISSTANSHPGRLSKDGCHFCRSNCAKYGLKANTRHSHDGSSCSNQKKGTKRTKRTQSNFVKYDRSDWKHWIDPDRDCQNTRQELLIKRSLKKVSFKRNKRGKKCTVSKGKWVGEFTGIKFVRSSKVHIDHAVALHFAHTHGGAEWSKKKKRAFANDQENLLIVEAGLNMSKGAKPPWEWLPLKKELACKYVTTWKKIIKKYNLSLSSKEKSLLRKSVFGCGS